VSANGTLGRELSELRARLAKRLGDAEHRSSRAGAARPAPVPPLDFSETREAFVIRVDVPGVARGELEIAVQNGALEIAGRTPDRDEEGREVLRSERSRGAFHRVAPLPREADLANVRASLATGVLTVVVPRRLPGGRRSVEIE
jgi:HSP20 family protein